MGGSCRQQDYVLIGESRYEERSDELNDFSWTRTCTRAKQGCFVDGLASLGLVASLFGSLDSKLTRHFARGRIVALTLLPSYLMFSSNYFILTGFYLDRNNPDGFQIMGGLITTYLNDSAASYLSVVGVVYSLVIAYLIQRAGDKILGLSSLLAEETSGVRNIIQMIKLISSSSSRKESVGNEEVKNQKQTRRKTLNATIAAKTKTLKLIVQYLESLSSSWNEAASSNYLNSSRCIDLLYSTLPEVEQLAQNNSTFAGNVADRIIDMCNEVGMAHSKRLSLQRVHISVMLWVLNGVLSAAMFFGISIIHTGSER